MSDCSTMWTATRKEKYGVAIYNFDGGQVKHGLSLLVGDIVVIKEQCCGWYRGFLLRKTSLMGIFPANYVHLRDHRNDSIGSDDSSSYVEDPVVTEVTSVLREWNILWKKLYLERQDMLFKMIYVVSLELIDLRRLLMSGSLTLEWSREIKLKVITKIDWGNKILNLDLVPRVHNEQVDALKKNPLELYDIHLQSGKHTSVQSLSDVPSVSNQIYQLMMLLTDFCGQPLQDYEIHFRLYNGISVSCISDCFITRSSKLTRSSQGDRTSGLVAVFTDLCDKDLEAELLLVAHVYRIGGLKDGEVSKTPVALYRRPFGCGTHRINQMFGDNFEELQLDMKLVPCNENDFALIHESLIRKQSNSVIKASGVNTAGLTVLLRSFKGSFENMMDVDPRLARNCAVVRRMGFQDIFVPDLLRNDLFVTLLKADIDKPSKSTSKAVEMRLKSTPKNIELRIIVLDNGGLELQDCIISGSGEHFVKEYNSAVLYHNNTPHWNETVRVEIPIERYQDLHIRFELRHCSRKDRTEKKLFGFAYIPLSTNDSTSISDGIQELAVFKCDDRHKLRSPYYLSQSPYCSGNTDSICIETMLCSTKLTQNADLLSLLKWRTESQKLYGNLEKFTKLEGKEVMKFLPDILDALFGIMSSNSRDQYVVPLAFEALVYVLGLLEDSKFSQFWIIADNYIENNFSALLAHKLLLSSVSITFEDFMGTTEAPSVQEKFQKKFQVLDGIGKFIVQSRRLHDQATQNRDSGDFSTHIQSLFALINKIVAIESQVTLKSQIILIKQLPSFWIILSQVLAISDIYQSVINLVSAVPKKAHVELNRAKLWCLKAVAKSSLFTGSDAKVKLLQLYMGQLKRHLVNKSQLKRCSSILSIILQSLFRDQQMGIACQTNVQIVLDSLLDVMVETVAGTDKSSELIGRLVACLMAMLRLMDEHHYQRLIHLFKQKMPRREFLFHTLNAFGILFESNVFPKDWIVMKLSLSHILFSTTQLLVQTLREVFLSSADFDLMLWHAYFNTLIKLITQPCLQLEQFSVNKRQKIVNLYGDMRLHAARDLMTSWHCLGAHKVQFVPAFVELFLNVTVVPMTELRRLTIPIFYDLMEGEQNKAGNFHQVENEAIDKLDILISEGKGDYEYQELFTSILLGKLDKTKEWHQSGINFVHSMSILIERLLDYRHVTTSDESREKHMICTRNLLNFYKTEVSRVSMYVRYVHKLFNIHIVCGNHTEAALTLQLHAELLDWSDESLPNSLSDLKSKQQLKWQGKEAIYLRIIDEFDKGQSWEYGLPFCEELASVYKSKILYEKLSYILKIQSEFYGKILNEHRGQPEYFRVGLYGQKFPPFLRNKEFIYRGNAYEKLESFQCHCLSEFSDATILKSNRPPSDDIKMADAQYVQLCHVEPVADVDPQFSAEGVPSSVSAFYRVNNVFKFRLDRRYQSGDQNDDDVKTMHIERTVIETSEKLPGILRWSTVTNREIVLLKPLEVAVDVMQSKNSQLTSLIGQYTCSKPVMNNISPLSMSLNGVIDAAVMGGIAKYQEAFLTEDFLNRHPESSSDVDLLKELIKQQVVILGSGLDVHRRLAPEGVLPLHQRLEELFKNMKSAISKQIPLPRTSVCSADDGDSNEGSIDSFSIMTDVIESPMPTPQPPPLSRTSTVERVSLFERILWTGEKRRVQSHSPTHWYAVAEIDSQSSSPVVPPVPSSLSDISDSRSCTQHDQTSSIGRRIDRKQSTQLVVSPSPTPKPRSSLTSGDILTPLIDKTDGKQLLGVALETQTFPRISTVPGLIPVHGIPAVTSSPVVSSSPDLSKKRTMPVRDCEPTSKLVDNNQQHSQTPFSVGNNITAYSQAQVAPVPRRSSVESPSKNSVKPPSQSPRVSTRNTQTPVVARTSHHEARSSPLPVANPYDEIPTSCGLRNKIGDHSTKMTDDALKKQLDLPPNKPLAETPSEDTRGIPSTGEQAANAQAAGQQADNKPTQDQLASEPAMSSKEKPQEKPKLVPRKPINLEPFGRRETILPPKEGTDDVSQNKTEKTKQVVSPDSSKQAVTSAQRLESSTVPTHSVKVPSEKRPDAADNANTSAPAVPLRSKVAISPMFLQQQNAQTVNSGHTRPASNIRPITRSPAAPPPSKQ